MVSLIITPQTSAGCHNQRKLLSKLVCVCHRCARACALVVCWYLETMSRAFSVLCGLFSTSGCGAPTAGSLCTCALSPLAASLQVSLSVALPPSPLTLPPFPLLTASLQLSLSVASPLAPPPLPTSCLLPADDMSVQHVYCLPMC